MTGLDAPIFILALVLLLITFLLGGSGRDNPLSIMTMELVGLLLIVLVAWSRALLPSVRQAPLKLALLAALLLVPVLQILPLPPAVWTALSGRAEVVDTLRVAGVEIGWAPLSLVPETTFRSLLWLIPPTALFLAVDGLDGRRRYWLVATVIALCIASLVLGGLQVVDGDGGAFRLRETTHSYLPVGFFANRNHQGIAMVAALPLAAVLAAFWGKGSSERRRFTNLIYIGLIGLLLIGVLVTRSRAALALAGPALIASIAIFWPTTGLRRIRREALVAVGAAAVALIVAAQFAISAVLERFEDIADREGRFDMWPMIIKAGGEATPAGTGLGAFESWYRAREPLELVGPYFVNHAHNDYLELWLETGIVFPALFAVFLIWLGANTLRAWRAPVTQSTTLARAASVVILVLLAHSVTDYPLRTQALACIFALAAACLTPGPGRDHPAPR